MTGRELPLTAASRRRSRSSTSLPSSCRCRDCCRRPQQLPDAACCGGWGGGTRLLPSHLLVAPPPTTAGLSGSRQSRSWNGWRMTSERRGRRQLCSSRSQQQRAVAAAAQQPPQQRGGIPWRRPRPRHSRQRSRGAEPPVLFRSFFLSLLLGSLLSLSATGRRYRCRGERLLALWQTTGGYSPAIKRAWQRCLQ